MKTQAWGWLAAAVMAAGLNASYHDGGLQWAHEIADNVEHSSSAVLALATGHADEFLAEARLLTADEQSSTCPLTHALAQVQSKVLDRVQSRIQERIEVRDADLARVQVMVDAEQAELARFDARRARIEARIARVRMPAAAFGPMVVPSPRLSICPRLRMNMRELPAPPMVHVRAMGAGSV